MYVHVPKLGLHGLDHSTGAYPRSKSAVGTLIPGLYMRGNPLCKSPALISGRAHMTTRLRL